MGFNTALLIVSPSRDHRAPADSVVWIVSELINIGYSYRQLPELTQRPVSPVFANDDSKARAGVVAYSFIYPLLCKHLRRAKKGTVFAPPFLVTSEDVRLRQPLFYYSEETFQAILPGEERILPFMVYDDPFPRVLDMQSHNKALSQMENERKVRREHNVISSDPMMWISCRLVAEWLLKLLKTGGERKQLNYDTCARARVAGWYGQLQAYSGTRSRVLFVYERITWP